MIDANNNNKMALNPSAQWMPITEPIKPVVTPLNVFNPRKDILNKPTTLPLISGGAFS